MSLVQTRMSLERSLAWAKVITFVGAFFVVGNLAYNFLTGVTWSFWTIGLTCYFAAMNLYGIVLWRKARRALAKFEGEHGRNAGRRTR